jgi:hypothetical protein
MGILWFTACQPAKDTQAGYGSMPEMPQQGEDGCKECTLTKIKKRSAESLLPVI